MVVYHSGTPTAPITFQATQRRGVVISFDASWLFQPVKDDNGWAANYITLRGLVFQNTGEADNQATVIPAKGWRIEDCLFQNVGNGIFIRGEEGNVDDITIERTVFEDTRGNAIWASGRAGDDNNEEYLMQNLLLRDVIIRRSNHAGYDPSDTTGAQKIFLSNNTRIENLTSYDNVGSGVWLDYENSNYSVVNSTLFGNHGLTEDWQGPGIWTEINPGPGVVTDNLIFSNTGPGIGVFKSQHVTIKSNLIVDVPSGIEFQIFPDRPHSLLDNFVQGNELAPQSGGGGMVAATGDFSGILQTQQLKTNIYDTSTNSLDPLGWCPVYRR